MTIEMYRMLQQAFRETAVSWFKIYMTGNPIVRMAAFPLTNQENADHIQ
jgi:hypothetical protein